MEFPPSPKCAQLVRIVECADSSFLVVPVSLSLPLFPHLLPLCLTICLLSALSAYCFKCIFHPVSVHNCILPPVLSPNIACKFINIMDGEGWRGRGYCNFKLQLNIVVKQQLSVAHTSIHLKLLLNPQVPLQVSLSLLLALFFIVLQHFMANLWRIVAHAINLCGRCENIYTIYFADLSRTCVRACSTCSCPPSSLLSLILVPPLDFMLFTL